MCDAIVAALEHENEEGDVGNLILSTREKSCDVLMLCFYFIGSSPTSTWCRGRGQRMGTDGQTTDKKAYLGTCSDKSLFSQADAKIADTIQEQNR